MIAGYWKEDDIFDMQGMHVGKLEPEELVKEFTDINLSGCGGWKFHSSKSYLDPGLGTLFITETRLIYLRDINPKKKLCGGPAAVVSLFDYAQARKIRNAGFCEYLELPLDEIHHVKKGIFFCVIFVLTREGEKAQFAFSKKHRDLLSMLQQYSQEND